MKAARTLAAGFALGFARAARPLFWCGLALLGAWALAELAPGAHARAAPLGAGKLDALAQAGEAAPSLGLAARARLPAALAAWYLGWVGLGGAWLGRALAREQWAWRGTRGAAQLVRAGAWAGWCAHALLAAALATAVAERASSGAARVAWQETRELPGPTGQLGSHAASLRWQIEDPNGRLAAGGALRAHLDIGPGGRAALARLSAERGGQRRALELRVAGPADALLELPPGAGPLVLELAQLEGEAPIALGPRAFAWLERLDSAWIAGAGVWLRLWAAAALCAALALVAAARCAPWVAAGLASLPWWLCWGSGAPVAWWPGGDLPHSMGALAGGFGCALPAPALWLLWLFGASLWLLVAPASSARRAAGSR